MPSLVCPTCGASYEDGAFCPEDGAALAPLALGDPAEQLEGQTLAGRYVLERRLGAGGMGVVYRARHAVIGRALAVKVLRGVHASDHDVARRFVQEAQLASRLRHANLVDVIDYGETERGLPYCVMELLEGHSLAWEIDHRGPLEPRRAVRLAIQMAHGLAAAHREGVVHRDLKPDNVYLCPVDEPGRDEHVKILDFGIARVTGRQTRLTAAGAVVGTPEYMSPEQAQAHEVDHRTDLYALGAILFEMLTGQVPLRGASLLATLTAQVYDAPPGLAQVAPDLPPLPAIEAAIRALLAKDRQYRPRDGGEVAELLTSALDRDLPAHDRLGKKRTVAMASRALSQQAGSAVPAWPSPALGAAVSAPRIPLQAPTGPMTWQSGSGPVARAALGPRAAVPPAGPAAGPAGAAVTVQRGPASATAGAPSALPTVLLTAAITLSVALIVFGVLVRLGILGAAWSAEARPEASPSDGAAEGGPLERAERPGPPPSPRAGAGSAGSLAQAEAPEPPDAPAPAALAPSDEPIVEGSAPTAAEPAGDDGAPGGGPSADAPPRPGARAPSARSGPAAGRGSWSGIAQRDARTKNNSAARASERGGKSDTRSSVSLDDLKNPFSD